MSAPEEPMEQRPDLAARLRRKAELNDMTATTMGNLGRGWADDAADLRAAADIVEAHEECPDWKRAEEYRRVELTHEQQAHRETKEARQRLLDAIGDVSEWPTWALIEEQRGNPSTAALIRRIAAAVDGASGVVEARQRDAERVRRLEDACLILWAEMGVAETRLVAQECPDLADFLGHLHHSIEHEQAMVRRNVWAAS